MPRISVVVPIYNVEDYLGACLDSLAAQTYEDFEAVLVDDGSTDGSARIAREHAARDRRFKVVTRPNGGLSAARNTGADHASGEFLAFVDSDDLLPENAYELLAGALDETGSDFATGNVRRLTRRGFQQSKFLRHAFATTQLRTHVTRYRPLIADRVAWNKLFRRRFWDQQGYRFPEGRLYEDAPVMIPAHFAAKSVDVISDPVYFWRAREGGERSITQRRLEVRALVDRLAAVEHVSAYLAEHGPRGAQRWYDESVLKDDLRLYLDVLDVADDEYRRLFFDRVNAYLDRSPARISEDLRAIDRLKWHLVRRRLEPELLEVLRFERDELKDSPPVIIDGRAYGDFPFRGDPALNVPLELYRLGEQLPVKARIDGLRLDGRKVTVTGRAFIDGIGAPQPDAQDMRLVAVKRGRLRRLRYVVSGLRLDHRQVHRPDVTVTDTRRCDASWSGFEASLDLGRLRTRGRWKAGTWDLYVTLKAGKERRRRVKWRVDNSHPVRAVELPDVDEAVVRAGYTETGEVVFEVNEDRAVLREHAVTGAHLLLGGDVVPADGVKALEARRADGTGKRRAKVTLDGDAWTARLPLEQFLEARRQPEPVEAGAELDEEEDPELDEDRDEEDEVAEEAEPEQPQPWDLYLVGSGRRRRLVVPRALEGAAWPVADQELALVRTEHGDASLQLRNPSAVLTDARWDGDELVLAGEWPPAVDAQELVMQPGRASEQVVVDIDVDREAHRFRARLRPGAVATLAGTIPLAEGWWGLFTHPPGDHHDELLTHVVVSPDLRDRLPLETTIGHKPFAVGMRRNGAAVLIATRDLDVGERGRFNQLRLRRAAYDERRTAPLRDAVFYTSFGGRHVADSPHRIHEELVRRGTPLEHRWLVRDGQAVVPDGASALRDGSREHYEALATSRYVVTNDRLPRWFESREDQIVLQTWHGTPVKQIGLDAALMRNGVRRFEQRWSTEVAGWRYLLSPSRFTTPILRDALGVQGDILETGLPRTDVLTRPGRDARAREVRARLGLSPDQQVVLYAPTFRDQLVDRQGRYALDLRLEPDVLRDALGPDGVVLVRRHPEVRDAVPATPDGFLRDVSAYPDGVELLLAADVLVTDYSSLMVDFANTGRPILVYAYDLETYRDRIRGLYVDVETEGPGPVVRDSREVADALRDLDAVQAAYAERYAAFRARLCEFDDGHATERVVQRVFG